MLRMFVFRFLRLSLLANLIGLAFMAQQVLAQEAPAATPQEPPAWMQFVPFMVIAGVFYFLLIRPQAKKQKEAQTFNSSLKNGDLVITQSGILGRITGLTEQIATLEVDSGVHIKVLRLQISAPQSVLQTKKEGK